CEDIDTKTVIDEYDNIDLNENNDNNISVNIKCENKTCEIDGEDGASFLNNIITINKYGTYVIEGSLNGQLIVEANDEDVIHIVLNDVKINSGEKPALTIVTADEVNLTLQGINVIHSSLKNESGNAVILSNSNLSINGIGSLKFENNNNEQLISCSKDLILESGEIIINSSALNTIKAKNSLCIKDAIINILTSTKSVSKTTKTVPPSLLTTTTISKSNYTTTKITTTKSTLPSKGRTTTKTQHSAGSNPTNGSCPQVVINLGYDCCKPGCDIIYVDKYANWGQYHNKWCGCGGADCSGKIITQGYRCCKPGNCNIYYEDLDGLWGIDFKKKAWCAIPFSCRY
ncbi:Non-catalytic module family DOC2, partial [Piromyces sp. E2]